VIGALGSRSGALGLFLGAKTFGRRGPRAKVCLILDRQKYRYQKFCSDIAGQDIEAHDSKPQIRYKSSPGLVANQPARLARDYSGRKTIYDRYRRFLLELPELRRGVHLDRDEKLIFVDYQVLVIGWIAANDWRP
jgi:hypothetical protein